MLSYRNSAIVRSDLIVFEDGKCFAAIFIYFIYFFAHTSLSSLMLIHQKKIIIIRERKLSANSICQISSRNDLI